MTATEAPPLPVEVSCQACGGSARLRHTVSHNGHTGGLFKCRKCTGYSMRLAPGPADCADSFKFIRKQLVKIAKATLRPRPQRREVFK